MALTTPDVLFLPATAEQRTAAWTLNSASWAAPMSLSAYLARKALLSTQALCANGGCKYWVVVPKGDPSSIVASCESTCKNVFVWNKTQGFRQVDGYAIASVYANPEYRRLGMAGFMLKELQRWLDDGTRGKAECSALYSDIGTEYYSRLGWPVFPSMQVTLGLKVEAAEGATPPEAIQTSFKIQEPSQVRYLTKEEVKDLCDADVAALKAKFIAGFGESTKTHVAFAPSYDQVNWQLVRGEFLARELFGKEILHRGVVARSGKTWAYFAHDWREQKLKIQRMVVQHSEAATTERLADIAAVLEAAIIEAAAWGLTKVLVWNPDAETLRAVELLKSTHEHQVDSVYDQRLDGSIPSLRWRDGKESTNTVWEENQFYCWC